MTFFTLALDALVIISNPHSNLYFFNVEDTTLKTGKDFDYKNVTDYKDITVKQAPMMIHVENKKIDHVYYKASDIKKALD